MQGDFFICLFNLLSQDTLLSKYACTMFFSTEFTSDEHSLIFNINKIVSLLSRDAEIKYDSFIAYLNKEIETNILDFDVDSLKTFGENVVTFDEEVVDHADMNEESSFSLISLENSEEIKKVNERFALLFKDSVSENAIQYSLKF